MEKQEKLSVNRSKIDVNVTNEMYVQVEPKFAREVQDCDPIFFFFFCKVKDVIGVVYNKQRVNRIKTKCKLKINKVQTDVN